MQKHESIFHDRDLLVGVVDEVGRQIAAIELHALDHVEFVVQRLAVFDRDHAFLADLFHRLGDDVADLGIRVGRDRADLSDFLGGGAGLADGLELLAQGDDRLVDTALEVHRVHAGGHVLHAFANDGLGQHGRGGGAITRIVGSLGGDFLEHLGAHVLELVFQLDFLGDRHPVLGDGGGAETALEHDIAAFRAEGDLDRIGQDVDAFDHALARVVVEEYLLSCHVDDSWNF